MATFEKQSLLAELKQNVQDILQAVEQLTSTDRHLLNVQPGYQQWSGAQVLEHLNFYNRTYLPRLQAALHRKAQGDATYRSGWLGNYFTKVMKPGKDGVVANKMSAPKDARPEEKLDAPQVVVEFLRGEQQLISLLEQAAAMDLNVRIPTSISKLIRLKAGDTFRFLIAHQQRHLAQLQRTLASVR